MTEEDFDQIAAKLVQAIDALEVVLDADLVGDDVVGIARHIIRHLITAELGREPAKAEIDVLLAKLQEGFERDATKDGEP